MVLETGVVLLKRINDRKLRLIYREDGKIVKHDFWYTRPAEGFVFIPPGEWCDPRSQEVHFALNMESHGSRYDRDAGVVATVPVNRSDYLHNRQHYENLANLRNYQVALEYWKRCSHAIGDKLFYNDRLRVIRVSPERIESVLSRREAA